jgi:hypothetical protein
MYAKLKRILPSLAWLESYDRQDAKGDCTASVLRITPKV